MKRNDVSSAEVVFKEKYKILHQAYEIRLKQFSQGFQNICAKLYSDEILIQMKNDVTTYTFMQHRILDIINLYLNSERESLVQNLCFQVASLEDENKKIMLTNNKLLERQQILLLNPIGGFEGTVLNESFKAKYEKYQIYLRKEILRLNDIINQKSLNENDLETKISVLERKLEHLQHSSRDGNGIDSRTEAANLSLGNDNIFRRVEERLLQDHRETAKFIADTRKSYLQIRNRLVQNLESERLLSKNLRLQVEQLMNRARHSAHSKDSRLQTPGRVLFSESNSFAGSSSGINMIRISANRLLAVSKSLRADVSTVRRECQDLRAFFLGRLSGLTEDIKRSLTQMLLVTAAAQSQPTYCHKCEYESTQIHSKHTSPKSTINNCVPAEKQAPPLESASKTSAASYRRIQQSGSGGFQRPPLGKSVDTTVQSPHPHSSASSDGDNNSTILSSRYEHFLSTVFGVLQSANVLPEGFRVDFQKFGDAADKRARQVIKKFERYLRQKLCDFIQYYRGNLAAMDKLNAELNKEKEKRRAAESRLLDLTDSIQSVFGEGGDESVDNSYLNAAEKREEDSQSVS